MAKAAATQFHNFVGSFGLLHHVDEWEKVVLEVGRILKPGGIYALDDFTKSGLERFYHKLFNGPVSSHFTTRDLSVCLEKAGLKVTNLTHRLFGDVVFLVAKKES